MANGCSYNGTSDLQMERLNVYFNEVSIIEFGLDDTV